MEIKKKMCEKVRNNPGIMAGFPSEPSCPPQMNKTGQIGIIKHRHMMILPYGVTRTIEVVKYAALMN